MEKNSLEEGLRGSCVNVNALPPRLLIIWKDIGDREKENMIEENRQVDMYATNPQETHDTPDLAGFSMEECPPVELKVSF